MTLADIENHVLFGKYPCRLPVWWGHYGEIGVHPNLPKISGKKVVLRIEKDLTDLNGCWLGYSRHPKKLDAHSMKKIVYFGSLRMVQENSNICSILDSVFNEDISPVIDRTFAGIKLLKSKNLMTVLNEPYNGKWNIKKGITPVNQELQDLDPSLGITVEEE